MNLVSCSHCGTVADFEVCKRVYGAKEDYYGVFTKCPNCCVCLYNRHVSKVAVLYDKDHAVEYKEF